MIRKLLLLIITTLTIQSCNLGTSKTWTNENIDKKKKEEISVLNDKLIKAIANNDVEGVKDLMSDVLLGDNNSEIDNTIHEVSKYIQTSNYKVLDEYNVHNSQTNISNSVVSGFSGINDYTINYQALNKEMFVSLLLPKEMVNEILITVIYGKYNDEWKINILQIGQYSLFQKTGPEYYQLAQENYSKQHLMDAINYTSIAKAHLKPANNVFQYQKEKEINDFYEKLMKEMNSLYVFPLTLEQISTQPKIFSISNEMINEGIFPMIHYTSQININDTIALKKEYEKIKQESSKLFAGIDKDKKMVFYRAYEAIPDGKKPIKQYGFVDLLSK